MFEQVLSTFYSFYHVLLLSEDVRRRIDMMAGLLIGVAPIVHLLLVHGVSAPYGRYTTSRLGFRLGARTAWFLQEIPAFIVPAFIFIANEESEMSTPAQILLLGFLIHYFNRTFIYSALIRGGKPTPVIIFLSALFFCLANGYMQGAYLVHHSHYEEEYLLSWNFVIGMLIFAFGMRTNIVCDSILRNLRKPGETKYVIPRGDMFEYVSAANLWGEAVEWCGWALACWSIQGFAFAAFAVCYLSGRSYSHHTWYLKKFDDYPKDRKIFIPFVA